MPTPTMSRRSPDQQKAKPTEIKKKVMSEGVILEFVVDNKQGVMPDIPQSDYGSCIMNMPLIQHQLIETEEDRAQIEQINQRIKNDIDMARRTDDAKNVSAHQTDFLFYKQSQGVNWVREVAFKFVERFIDLNRWKLYPVDGWGIRYQKGDRTKKHAHWPHSWAYVYFVDCGDDCSPLEIYSEPDPAIQRTLDLAREHDKSGQAIPESIAYQRHSVKPEPGKLCIFPGWVPHEVKEQQSERARYVVAGNIAQIAVHPQGIEVNVDGYISGKA